MKHYRLVEVEPQQAECPSCGAKLAGKGLIHCANDNCPLSHLCMFAKAWREIARLAGKLPEVEASDTTVKFEAYTKRCGSTNMGSGNLTELPAPREPFTVDFSAALGGEPGE